MSVICFYIPLAQYIARWFIHDMGGNYPVSLMRGSIERKFVELYISTMPEDGSPSLPGDGLVAVRVPSFRGKSTEDYCYLAPTFVNRLVKIIYNRFDIELWNGLHCFGKITSEQKYIIEAWMIKHEIPIDDTNWNAVAKRYQRLRNIYLHRRRAARQYQQKKLKKSH